MATPIRSRHRSFLVLVALLTVAALPGAILPACGGGSTAAIAPPEALPVVDLGTLPLTTESRSEVAFTNPLSAPATVTATIAPSPFAPDADDLPLTAEPGGTADFGVLFTPTRPGVATSTLTVRFEAAGQVEVQAFTVRANAEPVSFLTVPDSLDFGGVLVGESRTLEASFVNRSQLSVVTFTSAQAPNSYFSIVGDPFPLTLAPGETGRLDLRYAPTIGGIHDGTLRVGPTDSGGPLAIQVMAEGLGAGSEVITEYGEVTLDASGRTPVLSVAVPEDAISLYLEGDSSGGSIPNVIGLYTLTGPGGKVYENSSSTGAYIWLGGWDVFSTVVPNTDRATVQLVAGGGTYTFRLRLLQGVGSTMKVRAIVERRPSGTEGTATIPLNVFLAKGVTPTAATAASDSFLQAVLNRMDGIFSQQGIRIGDVDYYDLADSKYDQVGTEAEFREMLALSSAATHERLNLFFVNLALGGGVVGVAATIAGPKLNGTSMSGVMSVYSGYSSDLVGLIAAHEIGHFVGLYHTVEQTGGHDFIDDTAECPSTGSNSTCPTPGGGYLMHWQALGGTTITNGQGAVIRGHPHFEPDIGGSAKPAAQTAMLDVQALEEALALPTGWCATCERLKAQGRMPKHD